MPDVVPIYLRLPPREIAYVKFIFATLVVLAVPDFEADVRAVVRSLAVDSECEETGPPEGWDGDPLGPDVA
jgi:hypothetical protein